MYTPISNCPISYSRHTDVMMIKFRSRKSGKGKSTPRFIKVRRQLLMSYSQKHGHDTESFLNDVFQLSRS